MKQTLQLRLGQHLTMTPQLQQAIRLLQLSTIDLRAEVQEALESNPLLEVAEEGDGDSNLSDAEWGNGDDETPVNIEHVDRATVEMAADLATVSSGSGSDIDNRDGNLNLQTEDIPTDLPVDSVWEDVYDIAMPATSAGAQSDRQFEFHGDAAESLHDYLRWQMELTPFSEQDRAIAAAIIDSVNDDGYLATTVDELFQGLKDGFDIEADELEAVLHRMQNFDPPGIAARDLRECLLIQLQQLDRDTPWLEQARQLVSNHLDLLGSCDFNQLMRRLKLSKDELQDVISLVRSLNPRPGSAVASPHTEYVTPDVVVKKLRGKWQVELNYEAIPRLRINRHYAGMIRRAETSSDNQYLKNQMKEARWFIKSLQSRHETLLKVASCIVDRQQAFLEHGEEAMKPLVLHDVAEAVGMHESTISRVTTKKYMHTPRGVFELKYFFSSHVSTSAGGVCSATAIRALIKKLVAAEHASKPLSDSKIAAILSEQGINVARRTVAKYREAMSIPPSNERKRLT